MKSIFLDTETTGLRPGQIAQLTYLIEENKQLKEVKNYFFEVEEMSSQAEKVHGFSIDRLKILSGGKKFQDLAQEIRADFEGATFIAHNVKFDKKFVDAEFSRLNMSCGAVRDFCTMAYFKDIVKMPSRDGNGHKNPKLEEVVKFYNISREKILNKTKSLFHCEDVSFHDARFDTVSMYICCLMSRNRDRVVEMLRDSQVSLFE